MIQREEMFLGIDVSKDWVDAYLLPSNETWHVETDRRDRSGRASEPSNYTYFHNLKVVRQDNVFDFQGVPSTPCRKDAGSVVCWFSVNPTNRTLE
jgi:hypothetical protein